MKLHDALRILEHEATSASVIGDARKAEAFTMAVDALAGEAFIEMAHEPKPPYTVHVIGKIDGGIR